MTADQDVMAQCSGTFDQFTQDGFANATAMPIVVDIHGGLDRSRIPGSLFPGRKRAPADDLASRFGHDHGVPLTMRCVPSDPILELFRLQLIGASRGRNVEVVNVVDCAEIGFRCSADHWRVHAKDLASQLGVRSIILTS